MITEERAEEVLGLLSHECMAIDFAEVNGDWYCGECGKPLANPLLKALFKAILTREGWGGV